MKDYVNFEKQILIDEIKEYYKNYKLPVVMTYNFRYVTKSHTYHVSTISHYNNDKILIMGTKTDHDGYTKSINHYIENVDTELLKYVVSDLRNNNKLFDIVSIANFNNNTDLIYFLENNKDIDIPLNELDEIFMTIEYELSDDEGNTIADLLLQMDDKYFQTIVKYVKLSPEMKEKYDYLSDTNELGLL